MHSLKYVKDYWRQVFNNISILRILDDEIEICEKCSFLKLSHKGKKIICTFSRWAWEVGQTDYLCHLSLFKVVNTFADINYFLPAVLLPTLVKAVMSVVVCIFCSSALYLL